MTPEEKTLLPPVRKITGSLHNMLLNVMNLTPLAGDPPEHVKSSFPAMYNFLTTTPGGNFYSRKKARFHSLLQLPKEETDVIIQQSHIFLHQHDMKISAVWHKLADSINQSKVGDAMYIQEYRQRQQLICHHSRNFSLQSQVTFVSATWQTNKLLHLLLFSKDYDTCLLFDCSLEDRTQSWHHILRNAKEIKLPTIYRYEIRFKQLELEQQYECYLPLLPSNLPSVLVKLILEYSYE